MVSVASCCWMYLSHCSEFRTILSMPTLAHLNPLVKVKPNSYGVQLSEMHPSAPSEIEIRWRTVQTSWSSIGTDRPSAK